MKQLKNQRGLTLVELLAVVVILAIIAAIAAVAIGNVINNSKDKAILSDAVMVLEGAKLANLDGACTAADDEIKCDADQLKPFVSGVKKLAGYDPVFLGSKENGGEWYIGIPNVTDIKNSKYTPVSTAPAGVTNKYSESDIKDALAGNGTKPSTP